MSLSFLIYESGIKVLNIIGGNEIIYIKHFVYRVWHIDSTPYILSLTIFESLKERLSE